MRKTALLFMTALFVLVLTACGTESESNPADEEASADDKQEEPTKEKGSSQSDDPGDKNETEKYLKEVLTISAEVDQLGLWWDEIRNASANGEIDDAELGIVIYEEVIPLNMELLERIEEINPPTEQTVEANETFIDMMGDQQLAFTEILSAIETGDSSKITSANSLLNDVRKSERELVRKLEAIIEEHDINIE